MDIKVVEFTPRKRKAFDVADLSVELQSKINDTEEKLAYLHHYRDPIMHSKMLEHLDQVVAPPYTQWQLQKAFDLITPKEGRSWKEEISARISMLDFDICGDACVHMTGGTLIAGVDYEDGTIGVYSEGYYHHIGS